MRKEIAKAKREAKKTTPKKESKAPRATAKKGKVPTQDMIKPGQAISTLAKKHGVTQKSIRAFLKEAGSEMKAPFQKKKAEPKKEKKKSKLSLTESRLGQYVTKSIGKKKGEQ